MADLTLHNRTQSRQPSDRGPAGSTVSEVPDSYWLFMKQTAGILFIMLMIALAWLLQALPLPATAALTLELLPGILLFLCGSMLLRSEVAGGKSLSGGGMPFLFLSLTGMLFSRGSPVFGMTASRPVLSFLLCLLVLLLFATLAHRVRSQSVSMVVVLGACYLLVRALPHVSDSWRPAVPVLLALFLVGWLLLWLEKDQEHFFSLVLVVLACSVWAYTARAEKSIAQTLLLPGLTLTWLASEGVVLFRVRKRALSATAATRLFMVSVVAYALAAGVILLPTPSLLQIWLPAFALILAAPPSFYLLRNHASHLRFRALFGGQILLAAALGLFLSWPAETRLVLLAGLCFAPAFAAWRYGHRSFRIMEHVMLAGVLVLSFFLKSGRAHVLIGPVLLPRFWAVLLAATLLCVVLSRLHDGWARKTEAGSVQQYHQQLLSLSHALVAAFLLAFHLILRREDSASLPWLLLWQGCFFFGLALLLNAPAFTRSALLSFFMAHSCYYAWPLVFGNGASSETLLPGSQVWVLLLTTLVVAIAADGSSPRMHQRRGTLAESFVFAWPYGAVVLLSARLLLFKTSPGEVIFFVSLSGWLFFALSQNPVAVLSGMKAVTLFLLITAQLLALLHCFGSGASLYDHPATLPALFLLLVNSVPLEYLLKQQLEPDSLLKRLLSGLWSPLLLLLAVPVLYRWNSGAWFLGALVAISLYFYSLATLTRSTARYYTALLALLFCLGGSVLFVLGRLIHSVAG